MLFFPLNGLPCQTKRRTQAIDRGMKSVVEIHKGVGGPDLLLQFLARDNLARIFQQRLQDQKWLLLKADSYAAIAQLAGTDI